VTKNDIARVIAEDMGLTHCQVREVIQRVLDGITETLAGDGRVELRSFGVFGVRRRRPRQARNPRTGERVFVPGRAVVTFKPGREMGERVGRLTQVPGGAAVAPAPAEGSA
jgi:nucleoid DNA-binding protein